jgi:hypothetical protein
VAQSHDSSADIAKPLVDEAIDQERLITARGFFMLFHRAAAVVVPDRVAHDKPFYSGKHKRHGMNLQVIASPGGDVLWVSGALTGSVHDKKAEWVWGVLDELEKAGLVTLADKGYQGTTWAKVPYKGRNKPEPQKEANRAHAKLRALGERANAQLKTWKILTKLRCCPWRAGKLAKAIHALQIHGA